MKSKTKRVTYKGIPAKYRAKVAHILRMQRDGINFLDERPKSPQEVWTSLNKYWAKNRGELETKAKKEATERANRIKEHALKDLQAALDGISRAHNIATTIEENLESGFESDDLGGFARLTLEETGAKLEQALCNLGLIPEDDCSLFVSGGLKREGVEKPAQEASKSGKTQEQQQAAQ